MTKITVNQDKMIRDLAEKTGLTFDGGDNRLFRDLDISVYASEMNEAEYSLMESQIETVVIDRDAYSVYAWNDVSGFDYWHSQGFDGDSNYIQVTVSVKDASQVDVAQLIQDVDAVHYSLSRWENAKEHHTAAMARRETLKKTK